MLKLSNIKVKIKGTDIYLIEEANMELDNGKVYVLNGKNGSGKSSLLSAIMGHPNYELEGEIKIQPPPKSSPRGGLEYEANLIKNNSVEDSVKAGIYMTMQNVPEIEGVSLIQLLHKAISKNGNNKSVLDLNREMMEYCKQFDIDNSFIQRDLNYKMSGGEKKQAELLHLLVLRPQYILIDEIDSGVDKLAIEKIFAVLKYMNEELGSTLLIVSHHTDVSEYLSVEKVYTVENKTIN